MEQGGPWVSAVEAGALILSKVKESYLTVVLGVEGLLSGIGWDCLGLQICLVMVGEDWLRIWLDLAPPLLVRWLSLGIQMN